MNEETAQGRRTPTSRRRGGGRPPAKSRGAQPAGGTSLLTEQNLFLFNEGSHVRLYDKLGAHPATVSGVPGTVFAAWAPNAERVAVMGDFGRAASIVRCAVPSRPEKSAYLAAPARAKSSVRTAAKRSATSSQFQTFQTASKKSVFLFWYCR